MSTKAPSIAVLQQKRIVELTEAWNRCKVDNARLEVERDEWKAANTRAGAIIERMQQDCLTVDIRVDRLELLLREVLAHNTPPLELRERIKAAVGETENAKTNQAA